MCYVVLCLIVSFKKGRLISLDGYKLRVLEKGTGNPNVIIEGGIACTIDHYAYISKSISKFAKVISYDHAGIGYSTPSGYPRTLPNYVIELNQLLKK